MLKKAKEDLSLLMRSGKHIFVFELTYKLAATAIVYPLAVLVLNLVFRFAGISYLTNVPARKYCWHHTFLFLA